MKDTVEEAIPFAADLNDDLTQVGKALRALAGQIDTLAFGARIVSEAELESRANALVEAREAEFAARETALAEREAAVAQRTEILAQKEAVLKQLLSAWDAGKTITTLSEMDG